MYKKYKNSDFQASACEPHVSQMGAGVDENPTQLAGNARKCRSDNFCGASVTPFPQRNICGTLMSHNSGFIFP